MVYLILLLGLLIVLSFNLTTLADTQFADSLMSPEPRSARHRNVLMGEPLHSSKQQPWMSYRLS